MGDSKSFCFILMAIILGWLVVHNWKHSLDTFLYAGLGIDEQNWIHALIVAIVGTGIFILFIHSVSEKALIMTRMTGLIVSHP